jgi:hypothetical protein
MKAIFIALIKIIILVPRGIMKIVAFNIWWGVTLTQPQGPRPAPKIEGDGRRGREVPHDSPLPPFGIVLNT